MSMRQEVGGAEPWHKNAWGGSGPPCPPGSGVPGQTEVFPVPVWVLFPFPASLLVVFYFLHSPLVFARKLFPFSRSFLFILSFFPLFPSVFMLSGRKRAEKNLSAKLGCLLTRGQATLCLVPSSLWRSVLFSFFLRPFILKLFYPTINIISWLFCHKFDGNCWNHSKDIVILVGQPLAPQRGAAILGCHWALASQTKKLFSSQNSFL